MAKQKDFPDINETGFDLLKSLTGVPSLPPSVKKATTREPAPISHKGKSAKKKAQRKKNPAGQSGR